PQSLSSEQAAMKVAAAKSGRRESTRGRRRMAADSELSRREAPITDRPHDIAMTRSVTRLTPCDESRSSVHTNGAMTDSLRHPSRKRHRTVICATHARSLLSRSMRILLAGALLATAGLAALPAARAADPTPFYATKFERRASVAEMGAIGRALFHD